MVESDIFTERVIFDERECDVLAILSTSRDVLIGTSLLKGKTLFIDFIDRRVEVNDKEIRTCYTRHRYKLRFLYGRSDHECTATNARDAHTT